MIYFFYMLAAMFSAGCVGFPLWSAILWQREGETAFALFWLLLVWPMACLFALWPWSILAASGLL